MRVEPAPQIDAIPLDDMAAVEESPSLPVKNKPRISLSVKPRPMMVKEIPSYPCLFCPSLDSDDLLLVNEPSEDVIARSRRREGPITAHMSCANSIPEIWVEDRITNGLMVTVVMGAGAINKDRWNLVIVVCCLASS